MSPPDPRSAPLFGRVARNTPSRPKSPGHTLEVMTGVDQLTASEAHLSYDVPQLTQGTLEFRLEYRLSAVVPSADAWIAFQPLQGTGRLAPRQATLPVTAERRGEGARV